MKIIITESQASKLNQLLTEKWSIDKVRELINPNEKPSMKDPSKGIYRKMIEKVLSDNQDLLDKIGVENRGGHYFKKDSSEHSPLSYMNTHYYVAMLLTNYFNVPDNATKEEAVKIIGDGLQREFKEIFVDGNELTEKIYDYLGRSKKQGDKNEIVARDFIMDKHGDVFDSVDVVAETGGKLDKGGVDIVATTKGGKKIYYQVKPFRFYQISDDGNVVIYGVMGRTPVYPHHHYWIYVNGDKVLEVRAKNLRPGVRQRDVMLAPAEDLVAKSDNLNPSVKKNKDI
jgi:hypothetical protein